MQFEAFNNGATVLIALALLLYWLQKWQKMNNTKKNQPPFPSNTWPVIGHLHLLKGIPHLALEKLADQYGPIFMMKLGVRRALVVSTAEMAKECIGGINDDVFAGRPHTLFVEYMTYNRAMFAFNPADLYWREVRKIITAELLSSHQVRMGKEMRISEIRSAIAGVGLDSVVDMKKWFGEIILNIIVRLVSGKSLKESCQGQDYERFTEAFRDFFETAGSMAPGDVLPFLRWFDIGGTEERMRKAGKVMDGVAETWLKEEKNRRRSSKEVQGNKCLIDVMLSFYEKGLGKTYKYSEDTVIKATCLLMVLGAADTTTVTLVWALSLLLNNKDVLKKTRAELDMVVGKERKVEESDLKSLVYLQAVVKETMRLYPAGPLSLPRESISDCSVSGYHIPAHTILFVSLHKIHRDPQVWEDPLVFKPERFLTTQKDYDVRGKHYEFMPFGNGKRICPGISFAIQHMQFTLASLLHGFDITLSSDDQTVDMTEGFGVTNFKATPLEVVLTRRLPHHLYDEPTTIVN